MKISIIIPCYNEVNTISLILQKILEDKSYDKEVIVIDDGSTDGSLNLLQKMKSSINHLVVNSKNFGKGYSIRKGLIKASGDIIIIQDADLEYDPADYYKLTKPIINGNADVVYGSRFIGSEVRRVHFFWHSIFNFFLTKLSNIFTNINLSDMEVGLKCFKSSIIKNLNLCENRFGFEPEITAKIAKKKLRIFEVGISYYGRTYKEGKKINWKDGISAIRCIIYYNIFKN